MKKIYLLFVIALLFSANKSFSMAAPAGDDCSNAVDLAGQTSPISSTTVGAANDFSFCTMGSAPDLIVYYDLPVGATLTIQQTVNAYDSRHSLRYSGACPGTIEIDCTDDSDLSVETWQNCTGATQRVYWIQSGYSTGSGTFTLAWSVAAGTCALPATNDDCGNAISLTVNADNLCGSVTSGNVIGATASSQSTTACGGTEDDDVWFSFVATNTSHNISLINIAGSTTDMYHSVWEGACPGLTLVAGTCSDANAQSVAGLTPGNTYFIRVYTWTATTGQTSTFDVCVGTDPPPLTITGCSGTYYDTGGAGGSYANSENNTVSYCSGVAGQCVSLAFTSFSTESCCDRLTVYDGPNTSSPQIGVYVGTALNGQTLQASTGCLTFVFTSDGSVTGTGWAANISCSPCPTCSDGILNGQEVGVDCGGPTCPTCPCSSLPISNDEACCATSLTVNPDNLCGTTTSGTVANATPSFNASTCGGTDDDDVWFSFVATNTSHYVNLLNIAGSTTDMYHAVYGGTCNATGSSLICNDGNSSTLTGLTIGNTYFVRVYTWTSAGGQTSTFDVCIGTPPPPPPNDECSGAISATVNASGCSSTITSSVASATASAQDATSCFGTENDDIWFSFVAPANGSVQIDLLSVTGSTTDLYHSVWEGICPALTLFAGSCSDPNTSSVTGLTPGTTYYIRVYSYTSTAGQTSTFDLCLQEVGVCGNAANNDYCSDPAILTQGGGGWTSSTAATYTSDLPANITTPFCGSIENNSWYQFTAASTSETFDFTSITGCTFGIQAQVYEVTTDVNNCCTNFSSVSNCYNPANTTPGTVTATGLTIGNDYILMIDGNGGANCDFTVSGWSASGILLPVTLIKFDGYNYKNGNKLRWTTVSEINNDYFIVQKSSNANKFIDVGIVDGHGNSNTTNNYTFIDESPSTEVSYYRLKQIDFDGKYEYSKMVVIESKKELEIRVYPNPSKNNFSFDISESSDVVYTVTYANVIGQIGKEEIKISEGTNTYQVSKFKNLDAGIYFIQILDENNEVIKAQKIIKE